MPYINTERRKAIWNQSETDYNNNLETAGELNYYISCILHDYLEYKGTNYQNMNDILGALEGAKLEFYRTVVSPYENKKRADNGPVGYMGPVYDDKGKKHHE